ncbi:hypothetical protein B0H13DRAFT_1872811 [Mycena leptocephala]|nr:hypothetical protein B0H13DRAFT_1872811 [Mycena leptocephala]
MDRVSMHPLFATYFRSPHALGDNLNLTHNISRRSLERRRSRRSPFMLTTPPLPRTGIPEFELNISYVSSEPPGIHISASIQDCFAVIVIFTDLKLTVPQTQAFPRILLKSPKLLIQPFFWQKDSKVCGIDGVGGIT